MTYPEICGSCADATTGLRLGEFPDPNLKGSHLSEDPWVAVQAKLDKDHLQLGQPMKQLSGVINPRTFEGKRNNKMFSINKRYFQKRSKGQCILAQIASSHSKGSVESSMNENFQTFSWRNVHRKVQGDNCPNSSARMWKQI